MANELLEKILHSKKVAYKNLIPLINPYLDQDKKLQNVNIFIDLFDIVKQLYNPQTIQTFSNLKSEDRLAICSEIINIVSHYRHFFGSRYQKYTTFYFFMSSQPSEYHKEILPEYREEFYQKRFNDKDSTFGSLNSVIINSFRMINSIMNFIPHVYFINTNNLEHNALPNFILRNVVSDDDLNIIISNDELFYQDLLIKDQILILELRGEKTRITTTENMYIHLLDGTKKTIDDFPNITTEVFPLILPFVSQKNYSIPSIKNMGYTRAMSFIQKGIDKGFINPLIEYKNNSELHKIMIKCGLKEEELEKYLINYSLLNHSEIVDRNFNNYQNIFETNLIDKVDSRGLRITNEKYFKKNPIILEYCFEGEEYDE